MTIKNDRELFPKIVPEFENKQIQSICFGEDFGIALTTNGVLYQWGNQFGQQYLTPTIENTIRERIIQIAAGFNHKAALSHDGKVYTWGVSSHGQLGHIDKENKMHPTLIIPLADYQISFISCGTYSTICATRSCQFFYWGENQKIYSLNSNDRSSMSALNFPLLENQLKPSFIIPTERKLLHLFSSSSTHGCIIGNYFSFDRENLIIIYYYHILIIIK